MKKFITFLLLLSVLTVVDVLNATSSIGGQEVVQCCSITNSGTRCKRRARPNTRYCKQHASSVIPKKKVARCRSILDNGTQCCEDAQTNSRYCLQHL